MSPSAIEMGTRQARQLRRRLKLADTQPADPFWAASEIGLLVVLRPFEARRLSGIHIYHADANVAVAVINNSDTRARQRFTLAHEIGHNYFDRQETIIDYLSERNTSLKEIRANCFAGEFLLPQTAIVNWRPRKRWNDSPQDVAELAVHYGTSFEATLYRLKSAGCIDDADVQALKARSFEVDRELRSRISEREEEIVVLPEPFLDLVEQAFQKHLISEGKREELTRGAVQK